MTNETKVLVGILAATVLLIVGGAFIAGRDSEPLAETVVDATQLIGADDPVLGSAEPAVQVVEFGDFQCPACGALHPILKTIKEQNRDRAVQFVYRHFPLPQHEHAQLAAEAAVEAQRQGKFWEYHDRLFEHQNELAREHLERYAAELALDMAAFRAALDDHTHREAVLADRRDGAAINISGTPSLFINGRLYTQAYTVDGIQAAIDAAMSDSNE